MKTPARGLPTTFRPEEIEAMCQLLAKLTGTREPLYRNADVLSAHRKFLGLRERSRLRLVSA